MTNEPDERARKSDKPKDENASRQDYASREDYDLGERTARFGEDVIRFARRVPVDPITTPLITQLVNAGSSVGGNYCEADEAGSRKEFRYRINVCQRESRESKHWLRMIAVAVAELPRDMSGLTAKGRRLWREAHELNRIFATIHRTADESRNAREPTK